MHIAEIWRYPVKSMAGERLGMAALTTAGIPVDRLVQVRGLQDRVLSARRYPWLLGLQGGVDERGEATIDGRTWCSAEALDQVRRIAGQDAHLERDEDPEVRFDVLPLLVATDGAIAAFGHDRRNAMTELTCATGVEHLMDYLDGSVSPELTEALERHVAGCTKCAAFVASYQATPRILRHATDVALPERTRTAFRLFLRTRRGDRG